MQNISILAQFRKKKPEHSYGVIAIRGFYNRKVVKTKNTGYIIQEAHWDHAERKVKPAAPNASLINANLSMQLQAIQAQLMKKEIMGVTLNRQHVIKAVAGSDDGRDFIAFAKACVKADYSNPETRRTYLSEVTKLEQYRPAVSFADIDFAFLTGYRNYMRDTLSNAPNTVWKSFKFINTMIIKALKIGGIILENPFKDFDRGAYDQPEKTGLEITDCENIEAICRAEEQAVMLRRVGIYFLLMCYSGMRFRDAMAFDPDEHVKAGRFVMTYHKFNTNVNFEVWSRLAVVIELIRSNRLKLSNKEFNTWLKVLGPVAGITLDLTAHVGRHTLGGFLSDADVPIEKAQLIMGHKDPRSTRIYYKVKNKAVDRGVKKLEEL